jgi:hypothetical protein
MKARFTVALAAGALVACSTDRPLAPTPEVDAFADLAQEAGYTYEVTLTNLTSGQPMSPAVLVTHKKALRLFDVGTRASAGIQEIAENGNPAVAAAALTGANRVYDVVTTGAPVHRIGGPGGNSLTATIRSNAEHAFLSLATMLICTNDGFSGLDGAALPTDGTPVTYYAMAYDAGTERNTEAGTDIVPPCFGIGPVGGSGGGGRVAESRLVRMHPGIHGEGALVPSAHGWTGPVLMVTVRRLSSAS